jgi:hypothetical protein
VAPRRCLVGGFHQVINGVTLPALGVSIALGGPQEWIGFVGVLAGRGLRRRGRPNRSHGVVGDGGLVSNLSNGDVRRFLM